ncbi:MAG: DUF3526 domain-containing protein, partial [Rhodospirillaceae bacterium]|nr:DUF3526 domain-containing protein [Rhodospirillaceae bacterium]
LLNATFAKQKGIFETLGVLSPRLAVQMASMELSETSLGTHINFAGQAEMFRRNMIDTMNKAMTMGSTGAKPDYRAGPELWAKIGAFSYTHQSLGTLMASLGASFMTMLLWLAGAIVAGLLAARKLKALAA